MSSSATAIFLVGVGLIAAAFVIAYSSKDGLQAARFGPGANDAAPAPTATVLLMALLGLSGVVLSVYGYSMRSPMKPARLVDFNKYERYDQESCTGIGFIHFNHRGKLSAEPAADHTKSATEKKND